MVVTTLRRLARQRWRVATRALVLLAALGPAGAFAHGQAATAAPGVDALARVHASFPVASPAVEGLSALLELRAPATEVPGGADRGARAARDGGAAASPVAPRPSRVAPPGPRPVRSAGVLLPHFATAPPRPA